MTLFSNYFFKITLTIFLLFICLAFIQYFDLDLKLQYFFYDQHKHSWFIDRDNLLFKFVFYRLPKYIIIGFGITLIFYTIYLYLKKENLQLQRKLLFVILSIILIPLIVATLKHYSPIHCPNNIKNFGGYALHVSPLQIFDKDIFFSNSGKCFPAGHASGGFALLSLYFILNKKRDKFLVLFFSLSLGFTMGFYQIAKGVHYLSDTVTTMVIALLVCFTIEKVLLIKNCTN